MKSDEVVYQDLERERMQHEAAATGAASASTGARFMIAGEAPILVGKACELMVKEMTVRAWRHTERNRRRTLQRQDVYAAVGESEMFDFLIDLVPRVSQIEPPAAPQYGQNVSQVPSIAQPPQMQQQLAQQPAPALGTMPGVPDHGTGQQHASASPSMNLSDAETQYAQLQQMQAQMQEQYMVLQQSTMQQHQADGSAAPSAQQALPQVLMNPHFMIQPPQQNEDSVSQWQVQASAPPHNGTNPTGL